VRPLRTYSRAPSLFQFGRAASMQLAAGETCFDRIVSSVQFAEIHQPAHRQTLLVFLPGFEELLDVNGFLSKLLAGFERAVPIMSMRARNVAGTCRRPG
jgi:hypothetical protein